MARLFLLAVVFLAIRPAHALAAPDALEVRDGEHVGVAADETIDDDVLLIGQSVVIAGRVTGDVFAIGRTVRLSGVVGGDLIALAERVESAGRVGGDVRAGGLEVVVDREVGRGVLAIARRLELARPAVVGAALNAVVADAHLAGRVGGAIAIVGDAVALSGEVGRDATVAGEFTLERGGRVGGDLLVYAERDSVVEGEVVGSVERRAEGRALAVRGLARRIARGARDTLLLSLLTTQLALGLLLVRAEPRAAAVAIEEVRGRPLRSAATGLALLIVAPAGIGLAAATGLGLPLALAGLALLAGALSLGWLLVAIALGDGAARLLPGGGPVAPAWSLLVGALALALIALVPFVGPIAVALTLVVGLGAAFGAVARAVSRSAPPPIL